MSFERTPSAGGGALNAVSLLRDQAIDARALFEATLADVTEDQAGWLPAGRALPIAAHVAHVLTGQDVALHGLLDGSPPLVATTWAGRAGFAEAPSFGPGRSWADWARGTRFELSALRRYGQAWEDGTGGRPARVIDDIGRSS